MGMTEQTITETHALYHGDCIEVMMGLPDESIDFSIYSPPFAGLYVYSSDERDLSNSVNYKEFLQHYEYVVKEKHRITKPGRMTAVHCMDITSGNSGLDHLTDFPGDIIRLHERLGWFYVARYHIWKEPLTVRNRTMMKSLSHKALTKDSTKTSIANADYVLVFRRSGENAVPVSHEFGLTEYIGESSIPNEALPYRNWKGSQLENKYSQEVWRRYASAIWYDIRLDRVLPYRSGREEDDEKHVHPLQLDVIERAVILYSNPGETVFTPFMGVGSEVFGAVKQGRKAMGADLKASYYRQAVRNCESAAAARATEQEPLFAGVED